MRPAETQHSGGVDGRHPAVAVVVSHDCGSVSAVCESTLNNWLDNADDDPDLEPADIVWL